MKILLIYPYFLENRLHEDDIRVIPQGLFYIGALLKSQGCEVEILDWHNIQQSSGTVEKALTQLQPDIIGFSILHANRWGGIDISRIAKRVCPQAVTVFGGVGATHLWRHLLTHFPEIDYIVLGEGEVTFLELVRCLTGELAGPVESIHGLGLRKSGKPAQTAPRALICDLDELPNPADYFTYQHVALTRGCAHNCTFCGSPRFWNRRVRHHSVDYFVHQLEVLRDRGVTFFYVDDDTFTMDQTRVIDICKAIIAKRLTITWAAISRIDLISAELLGWMRRAGCIQISYGVENGSVDIRRRLGKNISDRRIKQTFTLTQSYGIMARAYFIYGCPQESDDTIEQTIALMHALKPLSTIFYILDVFPGTALYDDMLGRRGVSDDIWLDRIEDILYFETDPDLSRTKILEWGQRLRTCFHDHLSGYVEALKLVDDKQFYPWHADFYSRLALTFEQGDYAHIDAIADKTGLAAKLYHKALEYHPDARAYLGLGIQSQKSGDYGGSTMVLERGLSHFPEDPQLNVCLGISYLNLEKYEQALAHLRPYDHQAHVLPLLIDCSQALGDEKQVTTYRDRLNQLQAENGQI